MNRLMVLAGRKKRDGWFTLDQNAKVAADFTATIPPLPDAILAKRWAAIELVHGIEHFYHWEAIELLRAFHTILEADGELILEQPNIEWAAKVMAGVIDLPREPAAQFTLWPLYGDPRHRSVPMCHKWGWQPSTLAEALIRAGFHPDAIREEPAKHHFRCRDFRMIATKQQKHRKHRKPQ